jgi:hypothetical protein
MKKVLLSAVALLAFGFANAQEEKSEGGNQTSKGKWLIEANTNFGNAHGANTSFQYSSSDDATAYNLGFEGGYFIMDNLALKAGLGFGGYKPDGGESTSIFSYKIGAKYYVLNVIPVQVDYSGASIKDYDENPSYLGFQAGYAVFLGNNVSIEPGIRFNKSLNEDFYNDVFQLNVGFALHF